MIDATSVHRLAQIDTHPHCTLSVYLSLDNQREVRGLALSEMIKRKEAQLAQNGSAEQWKTMADDCRRVIRYVDDLPMHPGRGLALFSCSATDMFEAYSLSMTVPNLLEIGPTPYIRPLEALASDHCRCLTVLIDRKSARFFDSCLGSTMELEPSEQSPGKAVFERDGGQGRTGDNRVARWEEQNLSRFFKQVAAETKKLQENLDFQQLIIGGSRRSVDEFVESLPGGLQAMVAGSFVIDTGAPTSQVSVAIAEVQAQARTKRQEALLAEMAENMGPGGKVASGLNQVLASIYEGQVHTLFVRRGFKAPGGVCPSCGRLRHVAEPCPICGATMPEVDDVVNLAVVKALDSGAVVEQVEHSAILDELGGIAANLRYS